MKIRHRKLKTPKCGLQVLVVASSNVARNIVKDTVWKLRTNHKDEFKSMECLRHNEYHPVFICFFNFIFLFTFSPLASSSTFAYPQLRLSLACLKSVIPNRWHSDFPNLLQLTTKLHLFNHFTFRTVRFSLFLRLALSGSNRRNNVYIC